VRSRCLQLGVCGLGLRCRERIRQARGLISQLCLRRLRSCCRGCRSSILARRGGSCCRRGCDGRVALCCVEAGLRVLQP
jgi:hypothetical protein